MPFVPPSSQDVYVVSLPALDATATTLLERIEADVNEIAWNALLERERVTDA